MGIANKANSRFKRLGQALFGGRPWRPQDLFYKVPGTVGGLYNAAALNTQFTTYNSAVNITGSGQAVGFVAGGIPQSDKFLNLPGTSGAYASTPDSAGLDITGDIDIRADAVLVDWTTANSDTLAAKWVLTGNQRSFRLFIGLTGLVTLLTSPDGTASLSFASTIAVPFTDGSRGKVRATIDVDNGAGNSEVKFFTRTSDSDPWVQLGSTVLGAVTSIFNSTSALEIGSFAVGTSSRVTGRIYSAQVYAGLTGTDLRADFNPSRDYNPARGTTMVSSTTGETYTINGTALVQAEGDLYQLVSAARPTNAEWPRGGVTNLLAGSDTLATQTVAVTAAQHTLSFKGTGTVTLTGTSTAGPLVGTGAGNTVSLTFTPTAGNLTLTVSGSVTEAMLNLGAARLTYQSVNAGRSVVTQSGIPSVRGWYFDGTDDFYTTGITRFGDASLFADAGQQWCVVVVSLQMPGAPVGSLVSKDDTVTRTFNLNSGSGGVAIRLRGASVTTISGGTSLTGTPIISIVNWSGSQAVGMVNSLSETVCAVGAAGDLSQSILVGAINATTPTAFLRGYIGSDSMLIDRSLSLAERQQLMQSLAGKYGVTLS